MVGNITAERPIQIINQPSVVQTPGAANNIVRTGGLLAPQPQGTDSFVGQAGTVGLQNGQQNLFSTAPTGGALNPLGGNLGAASGAQLSQAVGDQNANAIRETARQLYGNVGDIANVSAEPGKIALLLAAYPENLVDFINLQGVESITSNGQIRPISIDGKRSTLLDSVPSVTQDLNPSTPPYSAEIERVNNLRAALTQLDLAGPDAFLGFVNQALGGRAQISREQSAQLWNLVAKNNRRIVTELNNTQARLQNLAKVMQNNYKQSRAAADKLYAADFAKQPEAGGK